MRALILGASGQLGHELVATAANASEVLAVDRDVLDITDASAVEAFMSEQRPGLVFNAAAYTAVDEAESDPELAHKVNVDGTRHVADACAKAGARLVHFSTDFVFDGNAVEPYDPASPTAPLGVYGQSKLDSERAVLEALPDSALIIRTSWLYSAFGNNFVKTMLRLMKERDSLSVVADQVGSPTWARGLAVIAWRLAGAEACTGIYHWSDAGETSWHGFAEAIQEIALEKELLDDMIPVRPITTQEYPTAAERPAYSVLNCDSTVAATGCERLDWRENLRGMLEELKDQ